MNHSGLIWSCFFVRISCSNQKVDVKVLWSAVNVYIMNYWIIIRTFLSTLLKNLKGQTIKIRVTCQIGMKSVKCFNKTPKERNLKFEKDKWILSFWLCCQILHSGITLETLVNLSEEMNVNFVCKMTET